MYRGFQQKSKEGNVEESSMRTGLHVHKIGGRDKKGTKQEYKHKHKILQMQICHRLDKGYKESRANIQIQKTRKANRQDIQIQNARNANRQERGHGRRRKFSWMDRIFSAPPACITPPLPLSKYKYKYKYKNKYKHKYKY